MERNPEAIHHVDRPERREERHSEMPVSQKPVLELNVEVLEERIAPAVDYFLKFGC